MRQPARPELRRLHDRRSGRRPRGRAPVAGARQGLLLRRLLRDPVRPGLRGPPPELAARADPRLRLSRQRPLLPLALPGRAARAAGHLPDFTRLLRRPGRPLHAASSGASMPPAARPTRCSPSCCSRGRWRRAPTSASTTATGASSPATRAASTGCWRRNRRGTARWANSPTASRSPSSATTTRCSGTPRPGSTSASASSRPPSRACRATTSRPSRGASTCSPKPPT